MASGAAVALATARSNDSNDRSDGSTMRVAAIVGLVNIQEVAGDPDGRGLAELRREARDVEVGAAEERDLEVAHRLERDAHGQAQALRLGTGDDLYRDACRHLVRACRTCDTEQEPDPEHERDVARAHRAHDTCGPRRRLARSRESRSHAWHG